MCMCVCVCVCVCVGVCVCACVCVRACVMGSVASLNGHNQSLKRRKMENRMLNSQCNNDENFQFSANDHAWARYNIIIADGK